MAEDKISIRIQEISINEVCLTQPEKQIIDTFDRSKLDITFNLGLSPDIENEIFSIATTITYKYKKNKNQSVEMLKLSSTFNFQIKNAGAIIKKHKEGFEIPDDLAEDLVGIVISTSRGIILEKSSGTFINKLILPMVGPRELLKGFLAPKGSKPNKT